MASEVQICQLALSHIGSYKIDSLSESSKEAEECNRLYPFVRDAVLEDLPWNFASKRATLAPLTEEFAGWDFAYAYPSDCIYALEIYDDSHAAAGAYYDADTELYVKKGKVAFTSGVNAALTQRVILTDKEDAILIYTARVVNPTLFSSLFIKAVSYYLAGELALPLLGDPNIQASMESKYLAIKGLAEASNANEGHEDPTDDNTFVSARG